MLFVKPFGKGFQLPRTLVRGKPATKGFGLKPNSAKAGDNLISHPRSKERGNLLNADL